MKYIKITCLLALVLSVSGCKKLLDINSDPASPQTAKGHFYLASIIANMGIGTTADIRYVQLRYTQNLGSQAALDPAERHGWSAADSWGGTMWRFVYIDAGLNLEDMITQAKAAGNNTLVGVGYAIKAWGFQFLTDSHGPIILDEAFKDQLTFKYQDQPEVYAKVREWAALSFKYLNMPDDADYYPVLKQADYLYGQAQTNNITEYKDRWKKFTAAVLATQYSHLINKADFPGKYADSVVKYVDLSMGGTVLNASEDATIGYDATVSANQNPFSLVGNYNLGTSLVGQPLVNYLTGGLRGTPVVNPKTSLDPRLTRMINPMATTSTTTNLVYRGTVATKGDIPTTKTVPGVYGVAAATSAKPYTGKYIYGTGTDAARFPLYSYAQLQFAKAEALFIQGNKGGAWIAYDRGIRGHMDFVNRYGRYGSVVAPAITAAEITAYMASSEVAQNGADLTIADIMGQKYIAQWGWAGQEQWTDLRKYHYDPLVFKQFKPLETGEAWRVVATVPQYIYRLRPRQNSEYVWNFAELQVWGADKSDYPYKETWFSLPD